MYQSRKKPSFWKNPDPPREVVRTEELTQEREAATQTPSPMPTPPPMQMQPPQPPTPPPTPQSRPTPPPPPAILPPQLRRRHGKFDAHYKPMMPPTSPPPAPSQVAPLPLFRRRGQPFVQTNAQSKAVPTAVEVSPQDAANPPANVGQTESSDETQSSFERGNPKEGILRVETFIAGRALPVTGVNIVITHRIGDNDVVYYNVITNEVGIVDGLTLPAPDASTSQSPDQQNPFASYDLYATRDSYLPIGPIQIQIFDGVKTIQPIVMQWRPQQGE